jgi:hypothetical protein
MHTWQIREAQARRSEQLKCAEVEEWRCRGGRSGAVREQHRQLHTAQATQIRAATAAALAKGGKNLASRPHRPDAECLSTIVSTARQMQASCVYATNIGGNWQAGDNTWGALANKLRYGTQCATQASAGSTALSWAACSATAAIKGGRC